VNHHAAAAHLHLSADAGYSHHYCSKVMHAMH